MHKKTYQLKKEPVEQFQSTQARPCRTDVCSFRNTCVNEAKRGNAERMTKNKKRQEINMHERSMNE